jgi:DNA invertase Pin-like site-specific DNA recombinase
VTKRAVIYIRTSTERQSEKVSPREQEHACHGLAEERGYTVVNVYRDTERYRVRGKLVEPSGSRADRPALRQMTIDGKEQLFDVILAWKEDRLYRGFRPMLDVLELVEDHGIDIELVRETFDRRMAPVKAWAAKMELESIRERVQMGREGRLKDGKMLANAGILGYDIIEGYAEINDEEMEIVRFIFDQVAWGTLTIRQVYRSRQCAGG